MMMMMMMPTIMIISAPFPFSLAPQVAEPAAAHSESRLHEHGTFSRWLNYV